LDPAQHPLTLKDKLIIVIVVAVGFVVILFLFIPFLINLKVPLLYSVVGGLIAATIFAGFTTVAVGGPYKNKFWTRQPQDSANETIAQYQNQTRQIKDMKWVLLGAIIAGTLLMMISIIAPYLIITLLHISIAQPPQNNQTQTKMLDTIQTLASAPKDVLPFATALAGFAGGVVTAMFRTSTAPPGQSRPGQSPPIADAGPNQTVKQGSNVALDGTGSRATTPDATMVSYSWVQIAGPPVSLTGADTAKPTFTAPQQSITLTFRLIVTDSTGAVSTPATVSVTVT
jgi:hypothetical protein